MTMYREESSSQVLKKLKLAQKVTAVFKKEGKGYFQDEVNDFDLQFRIINDMPIIEVIEVLSDGEIMLGTSEYHPSFFVNELSVFSQLGIRFGTLRIRLFKNEMEVLDGSRHLVNTVIQAGSNKTPWMKRTQVFNNNNERTAEITSLGRDNVNWAAERQFCISYEKNIPIYTKIHLLFTLFCYEMTMFFLEINTKRRRYRSKCLCI